MHPYIPFLLEEIQSAHRACSCGCNREPGSTCLEEELLNANQLLDVEDSDFTFSDFCGLKALDFPPTYQLTDEDIQVVVSALECLLVTWHVELDLPEELPLHIYYKYLVLILDNPYMDDLQGYVLYSFYDDAVANDELSQWCSPVGHLVMVHQGTHQMEDRDDLYSQ